MDRLICFCANYINPEGRGVADDLKQFKITDKSLHIIANGNVRGVDLSWYDRTEEVEEYAKNIRKVDSLTFCYIGRLVGDKGVNELAHAFDKLSTEYSHVRLILIGVFEENLDPLTKETITIIQKNKKIELVGRQSDVRPFLAASDAFVLPSYREGFPNSVLEAGALGLPAIVTDINGCNEIIFQGENGEIIPPRDEKALYEKMKEWVENPHKVAYMAKNARPLIEERYDQKLVWSALLVEYRRLTDK